VRVMGEGWKGEALKIPKPPFRHRPIKIRPLILLSVPPPPPSPSLSLLPLHCIITTNS
jgi:hypothetical protein